MVVYYNHGKTSSHAYNNNRKILLAKISSYAHNL